jgi:predicted Co/Zn/Cd cation transporter (cation efflux family)
MKAIEGISGAAVLYTLINTILTCCLGGRPFLAIFSCILDICFAGGFIAIAVLTRQGASSCSGYIHTPLGSGDSWYAAPSKHYGLIPYLSKVCSKNKAVFAISIVATVLFVASTIMQLVLFSRRKPRNSSVTAEHLTKA